MVGPSFRAIWGGGHGAPAKWWYLSPSQIGRTQNAAAFHAPAHQSRATIGRGGFSAIIWPKVCLGEKIGARGPPPLPWHGSSVSFPISQIPSLRIARSAIALVLRQLFRRRVLYALSQWHSITAYLFEPSAYRTVRQAHHARLGGDRRPFASENQVDDGDRAIPPGTDIVVRPRFSRVRAMKRQRHESMKQPTASRGEERSLLHAKGSSFASMLSPSRLEGIFMMQNLNRETVAW